jgi:hypothetical protein
MACRQGEWHVLGIRELDLVHQVERLEEREGVDQPTATPLTGTEKCLASASMAVPSGYFVGASEPQMRRM